MSLNLKQYLRTPLDDPEINADLHSFVEIEETVLGRKYDRMLKLIEHADIDTRNELYLQHYLKERGWDLDLELDYTQQRKLLKHIIEINKGRGTTDTIIFVIKLLLGLELTYSLINHITLGYWRVGYSKVGIDTKVGSEDEKTTRVRLDCNGTLTEQQKINIKKIVHYLRAVTLEYLWGWEIEEKQTLDRRLRVGYSQVGISTRVN